MSEIVETKLCRFRRVTDGDKKWWLWECPRCRQWGQLSEKQWNGGISVQCGDGKRYCGYHETHNFSAELVAAMQASILVGQHPSKEDVAV